MSIRLNALFAPTRPTPNHRGGQVIRHTATNTPYIAQAFNSTTHPELLPLPPSPSVPDNRIVAFAAAFRVLNHENLLPPLGPIWTASATPLIETGQFDANGREWGYSLVYEHASDGSLAQVFDNPPVEVAEHGFLPEGMVWHVCLGMLRATAWLHEGMRERVFLEDDGVLSRGWWRVDGDWMPILHRGVKEKNIWFMPTRGRESYGMVKLGGFERAVVCSGGEEMVYAFEDGGDGSLETDKEDWREIWTEDWREMDAVSIGCKIWI
jgi:serine/threonine protein kinase